MRFFFPIVSYKKKKKQDTLPKARWSPANAVYRIPSFYLRDIVSLCEVGCQDKASEPI